ncbi:hypothetical protein [Methanopyrus kandleri]|uniref:Uncharacterized protein n=1 Tax=Methanopyrus kandleri TaxID=2320 RepID=A0A832T190_9EURY|nr:hypothetical protein [Methanopyrus kandleri]HII69735.1 hypothetical protein [Methanopyrus kandleri]
MSEDERLRKVKEALKSGRLSLTDAVLATICVAYREFNMGITCDEIVKVLRKLGYNNVNKRKIYSLASRLKKEGLIESNRVSGRAIYAIKDEDKAIERVLGKTRSVKAEDLLKALEEV